MRGAGVALAGLEGVGAAGVVVDAVPDQVLELESVLEFGFGLLLEVVVE